MKKIKILFIILSCIILMGCIVLSCVMTINQLETNKYEIKDNFKNIKIITDTADVVFLTSEKIQNLVVCDEQENMKHSVKVINNTLLIEIIDTRKWYEYIGINFNKSKITIYLPKAEYSELLIKSSTGNVSIPNNFKFTNMDILNDTGNIMNSASVYGNMKIKTSTGDIYTKNINANMIELSTSTGNIDLRNVDCYSDIKINVSTGDTNIVDSNCNNLLSRGSTGNIFLKNVIATEKFSIERSTGDIKFKDCDASDIFVKTDTGDVIGSLLTDKVIFAQTDTGSIDVPKVMADEKCEITTDTGDIKITIS